MKSPRSEIITVTPRQAEHWLSTAMFERQRRRAEWHVKRLATEMQEGRFIAGTQIHFGVLDGQMKLVNGQHTLAAVARSGQPVELSVLKTPVASEEELGELYARHDRHKSRKPHDAYVGMGLAEKLDLSEAEVNALGAGLRWMLNDFRKQTVHEPSMPPDQLGHEMKNWAHVASLYFEAVRDAGHGLKSAFRWAMVVGVGLATFGEQPELAKKFWSQAAKPDNLTKNDPRLVLSLYLAGNGPRKTDPLNFVRMIAATWNKFYEQGEIQIHRPSDSGKIGVTIKGTRFKAKKKVNGNGGRVDEPDRPMPTVQGILGEARV